MNPGSSPEGIVPRHSYNEVTNILGNLLSPRPSGTTLPSPIPAESLLVPTDGCDAGAVTANRARRTTFMGGTGSLGPGSDWTGYSSIVTGGQREMDDLDPIFGHCDLQLFFYCL